MKLNRLVSTTQRPSQESIERARHVPDERIRRVEALEGAESDRQRSLQQEIAEIEPGAIGAFNGGEQVLQGAREVAAQLASLGTAVDGLIKPTSLAMNIHGVDDKA
ncbi:MAG: hypothetical protein H6R13_2269 [Proteobacteria bacterium]|nr:hypothetical protein [Pseudomonadota bacterium]